MKEPDPGQNDDTSESRTPPDFESLTPPTDVVRGERTRDDFFDAVLGVDSPATASEIATLAGHGVDAAREYLQWFERLGIVTKVTESPATYQRNQEYLNWRRVQQLTAEYSEEELLTFLTDEVEREETYSEQFDAESPDAISITAYAAETDRSVAEVWEDVSMWKTARRRIALLERALTTGTSGTADQRTSV